MATDTPHPWPYSDAPEVVEVAPHHETGLEPVEHSTLEAVQPGEEEAWKHTSQHYSTLEPHAYNYNTNSERSKQKATPRSSSPTEYTPALADKTQSAGGGDGNVHRGHEGLQPRRRNRRKLYIWGGIIAILAIAGIVLGCVLGLRKQGDPTSGAGNSNSNQTSVCRNTICPQTIAVPQNYNGRLTIFARGADNLIHWRYAPDNGQGGWQPIPGVEFLSQPSSIAWNSGQVQVSAISSDTSTGESAAKGNVFTTWIRPEISGANFQQWFNLGETAAGGVPMCVVPKDAWISGYSAAQRANVTVSNRLDAWTVSAASKNVAHDFWKPDINAWMSPDQTTAWDTTGDPDAIVGSVPAVTCRNSPILHDMLVYTPQGVAKWHSYSNETGNWTNWSEIPDTWFAGDPVTVAVGDDRWDFFGIDARSKVLQHASWTAADGLSKLEALGELQLESVPSVIVSGPKQRIDVVALGPDDRVMHQALVGTAWNAAWEPVSDFAGNSAPVVTNFKCGTTASDCTAVMVLAQNGSMSYAYWASTTSRTWNATMHWEDLGGNLTTDYMQVS